MKEVIDLRTDNEKAREARYHEMGKRFNELMTMPFATPTRVFKYIAKEYNTTFLTVRINLIKLGYYTPNNGDGRAEGSE